MANVESAVFQAGVRRICDHWHVTVDLSRTPENPNLLIVRSHGGQTIQLDEFLPHEESVKRLEAWLRTIAPFQPLSSIPMMLGDSVIDKALTELGYQGEPVIVVASDLVGAARRLAHSHNLGYRVADDLGSGTWYVEWNGRKVGGVSA